MPVRLSRLFPRTATWASDCLLLLVVLCEVDASWTFDPSKCDADSNTHCTSWLRFCTCKNPEQGADLAT
eukprot:2220725-Amphidinium_carterae.1